MAGTDGERDFRAKLRRKADPDSSVLMTGMAGLSLTTIVVHRTHGFNVTALAQMQDTAGRSGVTASQPGCLDISSVMSTISGVPGSPSLSKISI